MIALVRGALAGASAGVVVVDVHGVGYRLRVPSRVRLGPLGSEVVLHTHLAVREDALDLYGFGDATTRDLFEVLVGVTGVGPKLALSAIDALGADGLRAAVIGEDVDALTTIPGVGRKGAQRMVLELREKLGALGTDLPGGSTAAVGAGASTGAADARAEVRQALAALGYGTDEVQRAVAALPAEDDQPVEALLRAALRGLGARA